MAKFKRGDHVILVGEHRYRGGVYKREASDGDQMVVIDVPGEWHETNGMKMQIYVCKNLDNTNYDSLKVDEDCLELYEEFSDDDVLRLFGVKPMSEDAHSILHKHYLKDGGLVCAGCSWKVPNRNGIRMKFATHLVEMLQANNVLPTVRS